jgi:hypothetical protein
LLVNTSPDPLLPSFDADQTASAVQPSLFAKFHGLGHEVGNEYIRCFAQTQKREHVHAKIAQLGCRSPHLAIGELRVVHEYTKVVHEWTSFSAC